MACRFPLVRSYPRALEVQDGCVVGDSNPTPPAILPPDFLRIGRHGLEIIIAVAKSFPYSPGGRGQAADRERFAFRQ